MVDYKANITSPRWTKQEEELLLKVMETYKGWDDIPYGSIISTYFPSRTISSVRSKLKRLSAKAPKVYDFSGISNSDKNEVLLSYLKGNSIKFIQEEFGLESLEETEQLCSLVVEPIREDIRSYAEEHKLTVKEPITLYKLQEFIRLRRKKDQFSKSALKRIING